MFLDDFCFLRLRNLIFAFDSKVNYIFFLNIPYCLRPFEHLTFIYIQHKTQCVKFKYWLLSKAAIFWPVKFSHYSSFTIVKYQRIEFGIFNRGDSERFFSARRDEEKKKFFVRKFGIKNGAQPPLFRYYPCDIAFYTKSCETWNFALNSHRNLFLPWRSFFGHGSFTCCSRLGKIHYRRFFHEPIRAFSCIDSAPAFSESFVTLSGVHAAKFTFESVEPIERGRKLPQNVP